MGSPLFGTSNLILLTLHNLLSGFVKHLFAMLFSCVHLLWSACPSGHTFDDSEVEHHRRPSPSLVPVPVHFIIESIKEKLPVKEYNCLLERLGAHKNDRMCVVCLMCMKASDEVRELGSCCHVYHRKCLDSWIDQGQITCPLCRSKLLSDQGEQIECEGDPWRRDMMITLFAED
ncbi:unnamed protein product [Ilex paraguariensis]|uniref:RING-type domain-containing protein n=1 Tax=Ilex paraguariensis TaxID=185542 RepID=A0ABC8R7Y6_9AQUA